VPLFLPAHGDAQYVRNTGNKITQDKRSGKWENTSAQTAIIFMIRNVGTKNRASRQAQNLRMFPIAGAAQGAEAINPSIVVTNVAPSPATALPCRRSDDE